MVRDYVGLWPTVEFMFLPHHYTITENYGMNNANDTVLLRVQAKV